MALECRANIEIWLDGVKIETQPNGFWVDEAIETIDLPDLGAGKHELELRMPFQRKSNIEWCYLLGDFGVEMRGRNAKIVAPVRELAWGDWTTQGLPFYAGNVTYHCQIEGNGEQMALRAPRFGAPLLSLELDGKTHKIAFAPFRAEIGALQSGVHSLQITAFGNRANAFGPIHDVSGGVWIGPGAWRTRGDGWTDEYTFKAMGLLSAPVVEMEVDQL